MFMIFPTPVFVFVHSLPGISYTLSFWHCPLYSTTKDMFSKGCIYRISIFVVFRPPKLYNDTHIFCKGNIFGT